MFPPAVRCRKAGLEIDRGTLLRPQASARAERLGSCRLLQTGGFCYECAPQRPAPALGRVGPEQKPKAHKLRGCFRVQDNPTSAAWPGGSQPADLHALLSRSESG